MIYRITTELIEGNSRQIVDIVEFGNSRLAPEKASSYRLWKDFESDCALEQAEALMEIK